MCYTNSVYMRMAILYCLAEDLSLLISGYICLTLWFSYVFFCLLLPFLWSPSPSSSDSSMCRFLLPASSCVQNLDHSTPHLQPSTFTNFRSQFKMVSVHTVFHLLHSGPFHSHFLCLIRTCSEFLHVILPMLVLVVFSAFIVLHFYVPYHLLFSFWENCHFPFLLLSFTSSFYVNTKCDNLFEITVNSTCIK